METLEKMPFEAQHKIFKRLAEIADSKSLTKEEQGEIRQQHDGHVGQLCEIYKHAEEKVGTERR